MLLYRDHPAERTGPESFAGMSMRYMIQNPKMEWQREAGHLQIKPEIALAQKDEIAIARGRHPKFV